MSAGTPVQCPVRDKLCQLLEHPPGRAPQLRCGEFYCHLEHEATGKTASVGQRASLEPVTRSHP